MSFTPTRYDPKRCHQDVPMKTAMLRYRQCKRRLPATGGYGPDGLYCYQHGAEIERRGYSSNRRSARA